MIGIQNLVFLVAIISLFGAAVTSTFEDFAYLVVCKACPEARDQLVQDIGSVVTTGQHDIKVGVEGLKEMKANPPANKLFAEGLKDSFKNKIYFGSLLTLIYVIVFFSIFRKAGEILTGFEPPILLNIAVTLLAVGLMHWAFSGFHEYPFEGWVTLIQNYNVIQEDIIQAVSPIPINTTNITSK